MTLSYDLTTFQIQGQNLSNFFVGILVETMTPKGHFEINWPLVWPHFSCTHLHTLKDNPWGSKPIVNDIKTWVHLHTKIGHDFRVKKQNKKGSDDSWHKKFTLSDCDTFWQTVVILCKCT